MGTSTSAVTVPHKIANVAFDFMPNTQPWQDVLLDRFEEKGPHTLPKLGVDKVDFGGGWVYHIDACVTYTKHGETLYCETLCHAEKNHTIYVVNEAAHAPYDNDICLFSDSESALIDFMSEMGVILPIQDNAAAKQTL